MLFNVLLTIFAQSFFSVADMLKRLSSAGQPFSLALLKDPLYIAGVVVLPTIGYLLLLYVFTRFELSRTIPILASTAVIFSVVLGYFFLKEHVNAWNIAGIALAVGAVILVNIK